MPLPHDITQMTAALSHLLPEIPDNERKEYLLGTMNLIYETGVVEGKLQMLNKAIEEAKRNAPFREEEKSDPNRA